MIKKLRIQNFMSLRDVTLSLEPLTVLIGRSGTGKSNIVRAIRFMRDYLLDRRVDRLVQNLGGRDRVFCATAPGDAPLRFDVQFTVPADDTIFTYGIGLNMPPAGSSIRRRVSEERLDAGTTTILHQFDGGWLVEPPLAAPPSPGEPALGALYGIPEAKHAHLTLTSSVGCYDFPGTVLQHGKFNRADGAALDDGAQNYLVAIDAISSNLRELDSMREMYAALRLLNRSVTNVELTLDKEQVRVGHQVANEKVLSLDLAQESEGFRRLLAHMIALYQQPPKQTLVFEEPEKGIYPGALAVLADYFANAAAQQRSQIVLTTHSPQLLKHFSAEQIRVVEMEGYETKVGPLAPEQIESLHEKLMSADELLTVDQARLDPAAKA